MQSRAYVRAATLALLIPSACVGAVQPTVSQADGGELPRDSGGSAPDDPDGATPGGPEAGAPVDGDAGAWLERPADGGTQPDTGLGEPTTDASSPVDPVTAPRPMRLISVNRPVVASGGQPTWLVNDTYFDVGFWEASVSSRPWVSLDVGKGPDRIAVQVYGSQVATVPRDYRIEVSADSTDGRGGTWTAGVSVVGNTQQSRMHVLDFAGQRWLRLTVTAGGASSGGRVQLNELGVRDATEGATDSWVFVGDSITAGAYHPGPESFSGVVHERHPSFYPLISNLGVGGTNTSDGLANLDAYLAAYPDVQNWVVSYGTNDAANGDPRYAPDFAERLRQLIARLQGAGKTVFVPRIPWKQGERAGGPLSAYNAALDVVVAETGASAGPDLYAWFRDHPEQLADGVHPTDAGNDALQRLWADAVDALYR